MHWSFFSSHPRAGKWLIGSPRICNYKEKALLRLQQHMRALKPSCAAASTAATTTEILRMMISNLQCEYFTFVPLIEYRSNGRQLSSNWCPSSRIGNNSNLVCTCVNCVTAFLGSYNNSRSLLKLRKKEMRSLYFAWWMWVCPFRQE